MNWLCSQHPMKLTKYNKIKNTNIQWLGDIPEHWEVKRIKDVVTKTGSGVTPLGGSSVYVDAGIIFIRSQNVHNDGLRLDNVSFITEEAHNKMRGSELRPLDILINITGASIGRTCIVPPNIKKANINQHIIFLRISGKKVFFISEYMKSIFVKDYILSVQLGSSKEALTQGQLLNMPIVLPPISEQTAIANYLDQKTAQIDKKVDLLSQKIEKYKELKKSLINETVCRGLDKNVKLKPSGIDWIGDIPEHWEVKRVKEMFDVGRGRAISQNELIEGGRYPVFSSQTENYGCLGYINTYDFNTNLLTWTTDGVNAGTVFMRSGKFNCTNICGTLLPNSKTIHLEFMKYSVQESTKHNKRIDTNGAKIMSNEMRIIFVVYPPFTEQTAIAEYLDEKTSKIDQITTNLSQQIEALKELRKTLINEVVTGKLKVVDN